MKIVKWPDLAQLLLVWCSFTWTKSYRWSEFSLMYKCFNWFPRFRVPIGITPNNTHKTQKPNHCAIKANKKIFLWNARVLLMCHLHRNHYTRPLTLSRWFWFRSHFASFLSMETPFCPFNGNRNIKIYSGAQHNNCWKSLNDADKLEFRIGFYFVMFHSSFHHNIQQWRQELEKAIFQRIRSS